MAKPTKADADPPLYRPDLQLVKADLFLETNGEPLPLLDKANAWIEGFGP